MLVISISFSSHDIFIPPQTKLGGYIGVTLSVCMYVCLSVCRSVHPCITKSCLGHNFKASNFKLHNTYRSHCGEVQCSRTIILFQLFFELLPFINFNFGFLSGHNFQSIEASNFKLHIQIDHIKGKCSVHLIIELLPFVNFYKEFLSGA